MKTLLFALAIIYSISVSAQNPNKLSFEIGYGQNQIAMTAFNEHYINDFAKPNDLFNSNIEVANSGFIGLNYQAHDLFDIGIAATYSFGNLEYSRDVDLTDDIGQLTGEQVFLKNTINTEAFIFGVNSSWYISHLLKFNEKELKLLQKLHLAVELSAGYGLSKLNYTFSSVSPLEPSVYNFNASGFQSAMALKIEYDFMENPIIGSLGLKFGYQQLESKTLKSSGDYDYKVGDEKHPINLDFSGFFGAVYLSFGK